jgi:hypothetical protein
MAVGVLISDSATEVHVAHRFAVGVFEIESPVSWPHDRIECNDALLFSVRPEHRFECSVIVANYRAQA